MSFFQKKNQARKPYNHPLYHLYYLFVLLSDSLMEFLFTNISDQLFQSRSKARNDDDMSVFGFCYMQFYPLYTILLGEDVEFIHFIEEKMLINHFNFCFNQPTILFYYVSLVDHLQTKRCEFSCIIYSHIKKLLVFLQYDIILDSLSCDLSFHFIVLNVMEFFGVFWFYKNPFSIINQA